MLGNGDVDAVFSSSTNTKAEGRWECPHTAVVDVRSRVQRWHVLLLLLASAAVASAAAASAAAAVTTVLYCSSCSVCVYSQLLRSTTRKCASAPKRKLLPLFPLVLRRKNTRARTHPACCIADLTINTAGIEVVPH